MTQLSEARKGNVTEAIQAVAEEEYLSLDTTFIISGHGEIITRDQLEALVSLIREMKVLTLTLNEKKKSEIEIITQLNNIQPPKETSIFIHDSTVTKWTRFWIKS